jgi:hypothetical protein
MLYMGPAGSRNSRNLVLTMGQLTAHRDVVRGRTPQGPVGV